MAFSLWAPFRTKVMTYIFWNGPAVCFIWFYWHPERFCCWVLTSHFWNNRTSRGKAALLNSAVFYGSTQINPLPAEAVELFLYTGLTVRWHPCKPWKKIKGPSGSLFPVTHMIRCQTLFQSASGGVSQSTKLFKITCYQGFFLPIPYFLFLLKYHLQLKKLMKYFDTKKTSVWNSSK